MKHLFRLGTTLRDSARPRPVTGVAPQRIAARTPTHRWHADHGNVRETPNDAPVRVNRA
jgi:hypothetical protein